MKVLTEGGLPEFKDFDGVFEGFDGGWLARKHSLMLFVLQLTIPITKTPVTGNDLHPLAKKITVIRLSAKCLCIKFLHYFSSLNAE